MRAVVWVQYPGVICYLLPCFAAITLPSWLQTCPHAINASAHILRSSLLLVNLSPPMPTSVTPLAANHIYKLGISRFISDCFLLVPSWCPPCPPMEIFPNLKTLFKCHLHPSIHSSNKYLKIWRKVCRAKRRAKITHSFQLSLTPDTARSPNASSINIWN